MPFEKANQSTAIFGSPDVPTLVEVQRAKASIESKDTGVLQTIISSWGAYNPVTAAVVSDSKFHLFDNYDPNYDPEDDMAGYEDYRDILIQAKNPNHMESLKKDIIRNNKYKNDVAYGGMTGVVSGLAAGILDPISLIAIGGAAKGLSAPKNIAKLNAVSKVARVGGAAGKTAVAGASSVALSEIALQYLQPDLTAEESIKAIAGGALLGGIIGGAAKGMKLREYNNLSKTVKNDFTKFAYTPSRQMEYDGNVVRAYNSAGAKAADKLTLEDLTFVNSFGFDKLTRFISPTLRVMQSNSLKARQVYSQLADFSQRLKGAQSGKAMPVSAEAFAKLYDKNLGLAVRAEMSGYKAYKKSAKEGGASPMSRIEYRKRISQALRRGDEDIEGDFAITEAAKKIRQEFLNPLKDAAIKAGIFDENIGAKFADSYLTRMWNPTAILSDIDNFQLKLRDWATNKVYNEIEKTAKIFDGKKSRLDKRVQNYRSEISANEIKIKDIENRDPAKFNYKELASVKDDYLEFIKREIGLQELGAYIARYELGDIANLVNRAITKVEKEPRGLVSEIVKRGGIKPDPDLKAIDITNKTRVGLFNENGLGLDVMMRDLADDGFFPEYRGLGADELEPFMMDDLRGAIEEDLFGNGVFKDSDLSIVNEIRHNKEIQDEAIELLSKLGITDYKNFYKNIYEDIKLSKRDLRKESKAEKERIKLARKVARESKEKIKPLINELKSFRNAEISSLKRANRSYETKIKKTQEAIDNIGAQKNGALSGFYNATDDGISEYVNDVVDEITSNLTQLKPNPDIPPYLSPVSRGPIKNKTLDVNDVDFEDYLENDIRNVMDYYRHHMGTQIEMKNTLGSIDLKDELKEISDEYLALIKAEPDPKKRRKLKKEAKRINQDIEGVRDVLLGKYKFSDPDDKFNQASIVLRDLQFMSKMGGVTLSSLPDILRIPMVNGFSNTFDAVKIKTISKELRSMATDELEEYALGFEAEMASRLQSLAEIGDPLNRGTALTRFSGNAANIFSKVTLINYWNDMMKSAAGLSTQVKMIKAIKNGENKQILYDLGIDDFHQRIIYEQIKNHGKENLVGIKNWDVDDPNVYNAAKLWKAAIKKESDVAIVTKSAGDLPLFSNTPLGRTILQFRTFLIASHSKVLLRGLQSNNKEAASAIMAAAGMVAMGMLVASMKAEIANRSAGLRGSDTNYDISSWNKRKWLMEGIDRSGLIALIMEPLHISDKATGLGPSLLTGQGVNSRYGSRNIVGAMFGPSVGTFGDIAISGRALASPITGAEVSKSDIYAARRIMPFQNAFIFRQMFDILERETGEAIGAK